MEKVKALNIYIGGDGGCVDVAVAKLTGYTLVSDKDLKKIEDEKAQKEFECKNIIDSAAVISDACDELASYNKRLFNALSELTVEAEEVLKFENIGNRAALKDAVYAADNVLTGNAKSPDLLGVAKSIADDLGDLIGAASSAAKLLGFLSHHLRGRLSDSALLDMADKADKLTFELEKFK